MVVVVTVVVMRSGHVDMPVRERVSPTARMRISSSAVSITIIYVADARAGIVRRSEGLVVSVVHIRRAARAAAAAGLIRGGVRLAGRPMRDIGRDSTRSSVGYWGLEARVQTVRIRDRVRRRCVGSGGFRRILIRDPISPVGGMRRGPSNLWEKAIGGNAGGRGAREGVRHPGEREVGRVADGWAVYQAPIAISRGFRVNVNRFARAVAPVALHHVNGILVHHLVRGVVHVFHTIVRVCARPSRDPRVVSFITIWVRALAVSHDISRRKVGRILLGDGA